MAQRQTMILIHVFAGFIFFTIIASFVGVFIVLRRMSLMADVLSHATLPGIVIGFSIYPQSYIALLCGGIISGLLGTGVTIFLEKNTRLKLDTILGIVLSIFFGLGLVLYSYLQKFSSLNHGILMRLLVGNPALITQNDCMFIIQVGISILIISCLFYKQIKLLLFDRDFAISTGYNITLYDFLLTFFLVALLSLGLPLLGVMLTSSLLVAPAIIGISCCSTVAYAQALSMIVSSISCTIALLISSRYKQIPIGPVASIIIITCALLVLVAIFLKKFSIKVRNDY